MTTTTERAESAVALTLAAPSVRARAAEALEARQRKIAQTLRAQLRMRIFSTLRLQVHDDAIHVLSGHPYPMGAYVDADGVRFFIFAADLEQEQENQVVTLFACVTPAHEYARAWMDGNTKRIGEWADVGELLADATHGGPAHG